MDKNLRLSSISRNRDRDATLGSAWPAFTCDSSILTLVEIRDTAELASFSLAMALLYTAGSMEDFLLASALASM